MSPSGSIHGAVPTAHYDLFKNNPDGSKGPLVATSRRCKVCGQPTHQGGAVIPLSTLEQVHAGCYSLLKES